jgi:hypothetical protein
LIINWQAEVIAVFGGQLFWSCLGVEVSLYHEQFKFGHLLCGLSGMGFVLEIGIVTHLQYSRELNNPMVL